MNVIRHMNEDLLEMLKLVFASVPIKIAKVKENAVIPTKRDEDAGYDIYACFNEDMISIAPHETVGIPCGIATSFSDEFCMILKERGSTGSIGIAQRSGVFDSGYRGEWIAPITNTSDKILFIYNDKIGIEPKDIYESVLDTAKNAGELDYMKCLYPDFESFKKDNLFHPISKAICQALITLSFKGDFEEVTYDELQKYKSERGTGKMGSSNK